MSQASYLLVKAQNVARKLLALAAKLRPYSKAVVAVAGFVAVLVEQVASGKFDTHALIVAGTAAATAIGVYGTANRVQS